MAISRSCRSCATVSGVNVHSEWVVGATAHPSRRPYGDMVYVWMDINRPHRIRQPQAGEPPMSVGSAFVVHSVGSAVRWNQDLGDGDR